MKQLAGLFFALCLFLFPIPRSSAATSGYEDAPNPETLNATGLCGVDRWAVKVLVDARNRYVSLSPLSASISELIRKPRPKHLGRVRHLPDEAISYSVFGKIQSVKLEKDSDVHIVLANRHGETMIVEIPAPFCAETSPLHDQLSSIRTAAMRVRKGTTVRVRGVAFFDRSHGQYGSAPNGIELHPVFSFTVLSSQ